MRVNVKIRLPCLDSFTFTDGGLTSDFLPGDEVIHYLHELREGAAPKPIVSNDLEEWGVGSGQFLPQTCVPPGQVIQREERAFHTQLDNCGEQSRF